MVSFNHFVVTSQANLFKPQKFHPCCHTSTSPASWLQQMGVS